jgi:hypothetical protein
VTDGSSSAAPVTSQEAGPLRDCVVLEEWHHRIPEYHWRSSTTDRPDWPFGLTGIDSLPLIFPAQVHAAR